MPKNASFPFIACEWLMFTGESLFSIICRAMIITPKRDVLKVSWHGRLAEAFWIVNQTVSVDVFSLFQQNINPVTHQKLTQRTIAGGIRFYDFLCSAQKLGSVMSLFDKRLLGAHRRSVAFCMKELERFATVRIRNGENVNTQNHEITVKQLPAKNWNSSKQNILAVSTQAPHSLNQDQLRIP